MGQAIEGCEIDVKTIKKYEKIRLKPFELI